MAYFRCGGGTNPTGNATSADVLATKTFSNEADGIDQVGSMPNNGAVSAALDTNTTSYTVPAGYHNGSGTVSVTTESKEVTAGTSDVSVSPTSGKVISSVTVHPTPSQTKSASPSTAAQTISPDSGKLLSSVSISAISPQRSNGVAATLTGQDSTGPYVYFPYGWYPQNHATYGSYCRMTAAQAVTACPSQTKTATPTTRAASAATVTPDSGKLLSSVTVNTNSVPNTNSGTYTYASGSTGGTIDMGATNTYRYVNAANVYAKGKADAKSTDFIEMSSADIPGYDGRPDIVAVNGVISGGIMNYNGRINCFASSGSRENAVSVSSDPNEFFFEPSGIPIFYQSGAYGRTTPGVILYFNNKLYVLDYSDYKYMFYLNGSTWTQSVTQPWRNHPGIKPACVKGSEIYVLYIKTFNTSSSFPDQGRICKFNGSAWSDVITTPSNYIQYNTAIILYNNELHILGLSASSSGTCNLHYKISGSSLVAVGNNGNGKMNEVDNTCSFIVYNGKIYMTKSYYSSNKYYILLYTWSTSDNRWYSKAQKQVSTPIGNSSLVIGKDNRLHAVGSKYHYIYDDENDKWITTTPLYYSLT